MDFQPDYSEAELVKTLRQLQGFYQNEENFWPAWMDAPPEQILKQKKFIVCGSVCRSEIRVLAKHADVIAVVDDFLPPLTRIFGIPVIDSDTWADMARNDYSVVSCLLAPSPKGFQFFSRLAKQWQLQSLSPLQFLHLLKATDAKRDGETGRFFWYGEEFFSRTIQQMDKLLQLKDRLHDPYSRLSWLSILCYRATLNPLYLESCAVGHNSQKFALNSYAANREFFHFSSDEVYVDGGAFDGDTIRIFLNAVQQEFKHIHSFEPSSSNNASIRRMLRAIQEESLQPILSRITLHEKGLWDSTTKLLFNPSQIADTFAEGAVQTQSAHMVDSEIIGHIYDKSIEEKVSIEVPVTSIDEATDCSATFIKLEIEGSELKALEGARRTIERNKPKMAISIYHKPEDLETLTDFVLASGQDYTLGFRQHNPLTPDATVLYCY